jgi:hypothetical protein
LAEKLTPESIATRLRAAKRQKAEALADYEAASAEVTWLEEGLRLFGGGDAEPDSQTPKEILTEIFPEGFVFEQNMTPSLRQAMVVVMREQPGRRWTVADLAQALDSRGWLPGNGAKRVSDMAGDMVRLKQVVRDGRGVYKLSPELAAALESAPGFKE